MKGEMPLQENNVEKSEREPGVDLKYVSSILDMAIDGVRNNRKPEDTEAILNKARRLVDQLIEKLEK